MKKYMLIQKKCLFLIVAVCMLALMTVLPVTSSAATSFSGNGTKNNPYIVTSASQLQAMEENLSAHYKLGANIDLSSIAKFTPIGCLGKPFKGTFTCDVDGQGKPLYKISNLTVYNDAGEKNNHKIESNNYPDYKEKLSRWEAGLFGSTNGAKISNIIIVNANITNTVVGQNKQNANGSWNPGQDEQGAAILVGKAYDSTITKCYVQGTVTSSSNGVGGLLGTAANCKITYCSADANVYASGYWCVGGLIGAAKTNVDYCSFNGRLETVGSSVGAFVGGLDAEYALNDCFCTGTVKGASSFTIFTDIKKQAFNCYTTSIVDGRTKAQTNTVATNNCYITNAVGGLQTGFGAASNADILKAFSGKKGWITTGVELPQIEGIATSETGVADTNSSSAKDTNSEIASVPEDTQTAENSADTVAENTAENEEEDTTNSEKQTVVFKTEKSAADKALIITLSVLIVAVLIATVVMVVLVLVKLNQLKLVSEANDSDDEDDIISEMHKEIE